MRSLRKAVDAAAAVPVGRRGIAAGYGPLLTAVFSLLMLSWSEVSRGAGRPPEFENTPLPAYPASPDDCYVLLKPLEPYVYSEDGPRCRAILANFNRYCDRPPQYTLKTVHPLSEDLETPVWRRMEFAANTDLVKWILSPNLPKEQREQYWLNMRSKLDQWVEAGQLTLSRTDLPLIAGSTDLYTVYRLDGLFPQGREIDGGNQATLMFAEFDARRPSSIFKHFYWRTGQLFRAADRWYIVAYDSTDRRFLAYSILQPRISEVAEIVECSIEHMSDRVREK